MFFKSFPTVCAPLDLFLSRCRRSSGGLRPFAAFIRGLLDYMQGFTHNQVHTVSWHMSFHRTTEDVKVKREAEMCAVAL